MSATNDSIATPDLPTESRHPSGSEAGPSPRPDRANLWEALPLVALVILLGRTVATGLTLAEVVLSVGAILLTNVLPGALVWRALRRHAATRTEDLVVGTVLGAGIAIVAQTVAGLSGLGALSLLAGPLVAIGILSSPALRTRVRTASVAALPAWWGVAMTPVALLQLRGNELFFRRVPVVWEGFSGTYIDMPFHLGLAGQLAHRGPTAFPQVASEPLAYHWFSHAWVAQIGESSTVELAAVLYRILPALTGFLLPMLVAVVAVRISRRAVAGPVAGIAAMAAGDLDIVGLNSFQGVLSAPASPSVAVATMFALVTLLVAVLAWSEHAIRGHIFALPVLAFLAAGAKGSGLPPVVAGSFLALAVALLCRHPSWRAILRDTVLLAGALAVGFLVLFDGGAGQIGLDPIAALRAANSSRSIPGPGPVSLLALGTAVVTLLAGGLARAAGLLGVTRLDRVEVRRELPTAAALFGTGLAGVILVGLFDHPGNSQAYFLRNAAPALAIASGWGVAVLADRDRRTVLLPGAILGLVSVGAFAVAFPGLAPDVWSPARTAALHLLLLAVTLTLGVLTVARATSWSQRVAMAGVAVLVLTTAPLAPAFTRPSLNEPQPTLASDDRRAFSDDQVEAARWLRDNSEPHDVVVTNRHCGVQAWARCDARRFNVAAYTERQVLVEGWAYTRSWTMSPPVPDEADAYKPFFDPPTLELNDRFLNKPTPEDHAALWELGVRWLYIDRTAPFSPMLDRFADEDFNTPWAWILRLSPPEGLSR